MHTVSFVNPNFQQGPEELNAYYLPYSVGTLWAYVDQFEEISEKFQLGCFIWRREDVEETAQLLSTHAIVGFSVYLWNNRYCNVLAKRIKEINPNVLIIFGGPEPPIEDYDFFQRFPYIDICVKTEGEISFKRILTQFETNQFSNIPGLLLNDNGNTLDTGPAQRIQDLDVIPSSYLAGYYDSLMEQHPEISWTGILETNRGCPYSCTFCDWGSLTYAKIKKFDLDRVFQELEWFGKNKIDYISITDANFGIFPERDYSIAEKLVEVQNKYANPKNYTISWAKNQRAEVIEIVKLLMFDGGATLGLNLSVQTLDDNTLEIIKRKNLAMNKVEEVFDACEINGIPLYTELILGLPGETLETWKNNYYGLYRAGNHTGISTYQAQLLENAEMNLTQRNLYCIEGIQVYDYLPNSDSTPELRESIEIVTSTIDLSADEMHKAQMFGWFQTTFHINGLTNYVARFLERYCNESYENFYEKLYQYIQTDPWIKLEEDRISELYQRWMTKGQLGNETIAGIAIHGWNLVHSTMIIVQRKNKIEYLTNTVCDFVKQTYPEIDQYLIEQLLRFQSNYVISHRELSQYPMEISFDFDFLGYIQGNAELNTPAKYLFDFPEDSTMSLQTFCEKIFFDRRKNFGKAWITKL